LCEGLKKPMKSQKSCRGYTMRIKIKIKIYNEIIGKKWIK